MKNIMTMISCTALFLIIATPAWAQDTDPENFAGKWEMTNETPRGTMTSTFAFEQEGNVLTGSVETPRGSTPISSGSVEGNVVTFTLVRGMGNRTIEMTYTGTLEGDTITGTMSTPRGEREFTMKRVES